jgi:hypothetical protein
VELDGSLHMLRKDGLYLSVSVVTKERRMESVGSMCSVAAMIACII